MIHGKQIQALHLRSQQGDTETACNYPLFAVLVDCPGLHRQRSQGPGKNKAGPSGPSHHASSLAAARCKMSESNEAHFCRGEYLSLISQAVVATSHVIGNSSWCPALFSPEASIDALRTTPFSGLPLINATLVL